MKIAIIGGGASGMILASKLYNKNVTIFERNSKLGKKLILTGNGKCNFTNDDFENIDEIYNNNLAKEIYKKFDKDDFLCYMKELGIVPKKENHRGKVYYYPNNNKSSSVYYSLLDKIKNNNINILCNSYVNDIVVNDGKFNIVTDTNTYIFDKVIIATGGMSYKNTGSDGSFYSIIKKLGHNIIKPLPALCGFFHNDKILKSTKGFRVDATVKFEVNNNSTTKKYVESGEIQFTENKISGIPIMNLSRYISREIDNGHKVTLHLDFYNIDNNTSLKDEELTLYNELKNRRENIFYKDAKDFLCGFLPDELSTAIINKASICKPKVENITDAELKSIVSLISDYTINDISLSGFENAQITIGGVDVNDINTVNLESKIVKNLYFIGEVIDIDGPCGGYNLQLAYSSASVVANFI